MVPLRERGLGRVTRWPLEILQRFGGPGRAARPVTGDIWGRFLIAFRSSDPRGQRNNTRSLLNDGLPVVVGSLAHAYARVLRRLSTCEAFLPTDRIDWARDLEAKWQVVRNEFERLRTEVALPALIDVIPGERYVTDDRWRMFILRYFGHPITANCALCPQTAALLDRIPGLVSANFSVLQPGARIASHHGVFAGVLRYHLALAVPEPADRCGLRVENETRHWREGASLLFDETRPHEAWNLTDQDRVVLLLDVKRPLPLPLRWVNEAVLALLSRIMPGLAPFERMIPSAAPRSGIGV